MSSDAKVSLSRDRTTSLSLYSKPSDIIEVQRLLLRRTLACLQRGWRLRRDTIDTQPCGRDVPCYETDTLRCGHCLLCSRGFFAIAGLALPSSVTPPCEKFRRVKGRVSWVSGAAQSQSNGHGHGLLTIARCGRWPACTIIAIIAHGGQVNSGQRQELEEEWQTWLPQET